MRNIYVDDLMKSVPSPETAVQLSTQLRELLKKGGFRLTKWLSNNRDVLVEIPERERASSVVNLDIEDVPTACALGLKWNVEADKFVWDVSTKAQTLAKVKPMTSTWYPFTCEFIVRPVRIHCPLCYESKTIAARPLPEEIGLGH